MKPTITMSLDDYNKLCELKRKIDYKVKKGETKYFRIINKDKDNFEDIYIESTHVLIQAAVNENGILSKKYDELEKKYTLLQQEHHDLIMKSFKLEKESKKLFGWL